MLRQPTIPTIYRIRNEAPKPFVKPYLIKPKSVEDYFSNISRVK